MAQNPRVKALKDVEAASETIINNYEFNRADRNVTSAISDKTLLAQQLNEDNFDSFIEKRK